MPHAYRLSLGPDVKDFLPEIQYIQSILAEIYGLRDSPDASLWLHYGAEPPVGAVALPAHLFPGAVRAERDGLHLDRIGLDAIGSRLLPHEDARAFDAFGLIFLLLSRLEERDWPTPDRYGRYPHSADFAVRQGCFGRALADEALESLARLITGQPNPPPLTRYEVILTHDVDRLKAYHYGLEPLRYALGDLLKRGQPASALRRLAAYGGSEPWASVRDLLDTSEHYGLKSHFYFIGPSRDSHDSPYAHTMGGLLRQVSDHIAGRGHCIGYHPGFGTAADPALWQAQRRGLEDLLGRDLREGRQHMLAYHADRTPDIWSDAGMHRDYSLAYPEAEGFRNGTCRLLPAYSLTRRKTLPLRQASTAIMEFGLFGGKYRDLPLADAVATCRPVIQTCRRFGGQLVVLYHTGQPTGKVRQFYDALLREAL